MGYFCTDDFESLIKMIRQKKLILIIECLDQVIEKDLEGLKKTINKLVEDSTSTLKIVIICDIKDKIYKSHTDTHIQQIEIHELSSQDCTSLFYQMCKPML